MLFQSTRPMRGATLLPTLPFSVFLFQSTRPMRGATPKPSSNSAIQMFQSTRPMRGATLRCRVHERHHVVSIHAPHAGRDVSGRRSGQLTPGFNPRAPCGARQQTRLRLPSFATYLWVLLATNMIFSAFCPTPLLRHGSHTYIFTPYFLFTSPSHSEKMLR